MELSAAQWMELVFDAAYLAAIYAIVIMMSRRLGRADDPKRILQKAVAGGLIVRDLSGNPALPNSLRITVGTQADTERLLQSLET